MMAAIPAYGDLKRIEVLRANSSWGVFGAADQRGTLNFITPEALVAAREEVVRGATIGLTLPLELPGGGFAGRPAFRHRIVQPERNTQDDLLDGFYLQGSSQWDGLRHVAAREYGYYNSTTPEQAGAGGDRLGVEHWARTGILGRGVLLDIAAQFGPEGYTALDPIPITVEMLQRTAAAQGVVLRQGDILLVRTGYVEAFRSASASGRAALRDRHCNAGLSAEEDTAQFLWDHQIAAVAADNPAVEWEPGDPADGLLHRRLIPLLGYAYGEWFDLEALAADSAADGRYTSFFASVPLHLTGGVGSPANAVAVK
jgi:kynurenine formamidase